MIPTTLPRPTLRSLTVLTALIVGFTFLPWLGDTLFNTKGEPREAIVALSMLKSGNFILPVSYGADIPYKPPFLAWMIAAASLLTGGEVTEFSSRLPSAIATLLMIIAGLRFYGRMSGKPIEAMAMALVTITSTEVFRAATACRVDMILTACMVMALYAMASARERSGRPTVSVAAVLLMTCAVLTKGPVGALLPCMIMWVYSLLRGDKLLRTTVVAAAGFMLSLIVPAMWYYAAYTQGGERFLNLVIEENFGRMTGRMSYGSHENPWWYNIVTLTAGLLPYTLLCLMALAAVKRGALRRLPRPAAMLARIRSLRPETLLALTSAVIIFIFYCIPKSKRSVYLLPMYPFMAYFIVQLGLWLIRNRKIRIVAIYTGTVAAAGLAATLTACFAGLIDNAAGRILSAICVAMCIATLRTLRHPGPRTAIGAVASALTVYWVLGASALPHILNEKSDIVIAREIERIGNGRNIYSYNSAKMLRYYTTAFYLGDTVRLFAPEEGSTQSEQKLGGERVELPEEGILIVSTADMPEWLEKYGRDYRCDTLYTGTRKSCDARAIPMLIGFRRELISN